MTARQPRLSTLPLPRRASSKALASPLDSRLRGHDGSTCGHRAAPSRQRGAILVVSLIMLLLLTIIGITAMSTTTVQERMAGNLRDRGLAFQAAETALRATETWLRSFPTDPTNARLGAVGAYSDIASQAITGVAGDPTVQVNELQCDPGSLNANSGCDEVFYRIQVTGFGATNIAQVTLVSTFARSH